MRATKGTVIVATLFLSMLAADTVSAYADRSPTKSIKNTNKTINALLRKRASEGSAAAKRIKDRLKKAVNNFLDFEELSRRALGKHWEKRTPEERAEFVQILSDLIHRNYLKQLRDNLDYKLEYGEESVNGTTARVVTTVKVTKDGRTEEVEIEYRMHKTKTGWRVIDVITDEVSIVRNYRSQFNRIIRRDSYEALVKKMRNKLKTI